MNKDNISTDNIILIGMPGAGKSTIGQKLAKELDWEFIDSDDIITSHTGEPLETILTREGLDGFLDTERDAVLTIDCHKTVIATGGSVVLREESMKYLASIGTIVYLRLPFCTINQRIKNFDSRGIARKENETLWDIFQKRIPFYDKYCQVRINCNKKSVQKIVDMIIEGVSEK